MSSRIGPIHHQMYRKILLLESLSECIAQHSGFAYQSVFQNKELEDIIDHQNIHGSLHQFVQQVQKEHAQVVEMIQDKTKLSKGIEAFGKMHRFTCDNVHDIYMKIQVMFLNGMPCDRLLSIAEESDSHISIHQKKDEQALYFKDASLWKWEFATLMKALLPEGYAFTYLAEGFLIEKES